MQPELLYKVSSFGFFVVVFYHLSSMSFHASIHEVSFHRFYI
jgi:hypothetical protein